MISTIRELEDLFDGYAPSSTDIKVREERLERMRMLLHHIGNPERSYRTYHTAGSKGKGTTSAYLAALISGMGRRCGLYTSPHMYSVRERFTLSTEFFDDELYITTANELLAMTEDFSIPSSIGPQCPTTFEMYTAYGYLLFQRAGCTDAVIETGLGGRLDATNTIDPEAVFLTPIELEHTAVLGSTIERIATEKSKIIAAGKPVFVSRQRPEARSVFEEEAVRMHAPIAFFDEEISSFGSETLREGERTSFTIDGRRYELMLSMSTEAMAENAALAILGAERLSLLTDEGIRRLEQTTLPGRFEKRMIDGRLVVIDGAHTVNSARSVRDAFSTIAEGRKTLIYSSIEGKDIEHIIGELFPLFDRVIVTSTEEWKRSDPEGIASLGRTLFPDTPITIEKDRNKALGEALNDSDSILITGSFYLASGMRRLMEEGLYAD